MNVQGYNMPDDLYYHKEHVWAKVEGNRVKVGITDFTQKRAGEISYVESPMKGDKVSQDDEVGTIETGKWVGKVHAPVSGTVTASNEEIMDDPTVINSDPYGKGWIFEIEMSDKSELENLMRGEFASSWLAGEIKKHG